MGKAAPRAVIQLQDITEEARDGKYHFLADEKLFALGRWVEGRWAYPGGFPLDFVPQYFRPASLIINPKSEVIGG